MDAKEYLGQAYRIDRRINSKLNQIAVLRGLATKVTATLGDEPVSGTRNPQRLQFIIDKIMDFETEINADVDSLVDARKRVSEVIGQVSGTDCQLVLEYRYLGFMAWDAIAASMGFSPRWVYTLHGRGLKNVRKILQSRKMCS